MISVIIPLYNKEPIIERTIRSVLSQDYNDFEVVIVNDGSTDKSMEVLKNALPRIKQELNVNTPVTIISQENGGPSKARNTGVKNAKGEWIVFLDADDELLPGALKNYFDLAAAHSDANIIDCGQRIKTASGYTNMKHSLNGYSKNPLRDWYYRRIGPGSNHSMFRTSLLLKYPYNEKIRRFEDAEFLTRILQVARVFSSTITKCLVHAEYSSASHPRRDIMEDYMGYLDMSHGGFWYKMCVFRIFIEERDYYPIECQKLYKSWYRRVDFMLIYKLLQIFS